jgi:hypothetical protein
MGLDIGQHFIDIDGGDNGQQGPENLRTYDWEVQLHIVYHCRTHIEIFFIILFHDPGTWYDNDDRLKPVRYDGDRTSNMMNYIIQFIRMLH